jgi:predicted branched-subunit amino acid permease
MSPAQPSGGGVVQPAQLWAGARGILPLAIGVFPFGLAYGVAAAASSMDDLAGLLASIVVVAGAAQLAMVDLIDQGAPWFVIVSTALVVNLRFAMYSGALASSFSEYPARWRLPLAHLITDQSTVTSLLFNARVRDPRARLSYYLGAGGLFVASWVAGTVLGIAIGASVPEELQLAFAVPLMFVALLVPSVRDRATFVAAAVGLSVTVLAREAPLNTGLLIGASAGIAFGLLARLRWDEPAAGEPGG